MENPFCKRVVTLS